MTAVAGWAGGTHTPRVAKPLLRQTVGVAQPGAQAPGPVPCPPQGPSQAVGAGLGSVRVGARCARRTPLALVQARGITVASPASQGGRVGLNRVSGPEAQTGLCGPCPWRSEFIMRVLGSQGTGRTRTCFKCNSASPSEG